MSFLIRAFGGLLAWTVWTVGASAAVLLVEPAAFDDIDLRIDGDIIPEISWIAEIRPELMIVAIATRSAGGVVPGGGRFATDTFADLGEMVESEMYFGMATLMEADVGGSHSHSLGTTALDITSEPVQAAWYWGTELATPSNRRHSLVGWVVDASAYAADSTQPVSIYYHNYGLFEEGESRMVSLGDALAPIPEPRGLLPIALFALGVQRRRR